MTDDELKRVIDEAITDREEFELKRVIDEAVADREELRKFPAIVRALQKLEKRIIKLEQENHQ